MGLVEHQGFQPQGEIGVPRQAAALGAAGPEPVHQDPHRRAGLAGVAAGPIDMLAAAAEAQAHQFAVHHRIHQPAGGGHLGTRQVLRQVAAGIRRRRVDLEAEDAGKDLGRETHGRDSKGLLTSPKVHRPGGPTSAVNRWTPGELAPGYLPRAQGSEMGRIHLTVDDTEIMGREKAYQMGQRDLGGVGPAREHGLAVERPADGDAIQPPRQFRAVFAFDPGLERVCMARLVQCAVCRDHRGGNPGAAGAGAGRRALPHHPGERRVHPHLVIGPGEAFLEGAGNLEFGGKQHHARVRRPPQDGFARD